MSSFVSRALVCLAFSCLPIAAAVADPEWSIHVTGESNIACELKKPYRISKSDNSWVDIWFGFYWLQTESSVPGYTLPAHEVILIIKSQQDFDSIGDYEEPAKAYIGEFQLQKYKFKAHVGGHAFFFVDGDPAQRVFDALKSVDPIDVFFELEDKSSQILQIKMHDNENFKVFAAMFDACGKAIAK